MKLIQVGKFNTTARLWRYFKKQSNWNNFSYSNFKILDRVQVDSDKYDWNRHQYFLYTTILSQVSFYLFIYFLKKVHRIKTKIKVHLYISYTSSLPIVFLLTQTNTRYVLYFLFSRQVIYSAKFILCIVLYCIEGVVMAAQCTATFSDLLCSAEFR